MNKAGNTKLKYVILKGNNSQIVKRCMESRLDKWEEANIYDTIFNFKWSPVSKGIRFDILNANGTKQIVNHF